MDFFLQDQAEDPLVGCIDISGSALLMTDLILGNNPLSVRLEDNSDAIRPMSSGMPKGFSSTASQPYSESESRILAYAEVMIIGMYSKRSMARIALHNSPPFHSGSM